MRYALYRLTAPILERIPDISHQPKGRQMSIGLATSLLLHLLFLLIALLFGLVLPKHGLLNFAKPKPKLEEIELTVIPPEPEVAPFQLGQPFIDSTGLAASKAPEKALFQTDTDMKAGSTLPPRGDAPIPTQDGVKDPNSEVFANQRMSLSKDGGPPKPPEPVEKPPTPAETAPPPPAAPKPSTEMKDSVKPTEDQIALQAKTEKTEPTPPNKLLPRLRTGVAMREAPAPTLPSGEFKTAETKTRTAGSISDAGPNAVDAAATAYGKYMMGVKRAVYSRWIHYLDAKRGMVTPGAVLVAFTIERDGSISNIRSTGNTSTATFANVCESALRDSKLPPVPSAVLDTAIGDRLDETIRFTSTGPRSDF